MSTTIFRNEQKLDKEQVQEKFCTTLKNYNSFSQDISELAELFSKNPTDNFIIQGENLATEAFQGDIQILGKDTELYKQFIKKLKKKDEAKNMNLQEGESVTGDHRIVPLADSNLTITDCEIKPEILEGKRWDAKLIKSDKPFLIYHSEHGNMGLPAGEYMTCISFDPSTLHKIID